MDWETIHDYAEEIEMWSSLFINTWLILSGIILFGWRQRAADTNIVKAGFFAFMVLCGIVIMLFFGVKPMLMLSQKGVPLSHPAWWFFIALGVAMPGYVFWTAWRYWTRNVDPGPQNSRS